MNIKYWFINIPWSFLFLVLLIVALALKLKFDTKHLNNLNQLLKKTECDFAVGVNALKKYLKNHPLSIYNDTVRTLLIPFSLSALTSRERIIIIKNNYFYFVPNDLNDFILFCCFLLKENNLETEYNLFVKRLSNSKNKKFLCDKIDDLLTLTIDDEKAITNFDTPILKGVIYFNSAVKEQENDVLKANEYFKKSSKLCKNFAMNNAILNRGGKIE